MHFWKELCKYMNIVLTGFFFSFFVYEQEKLNKSLKRNNDFPGDMEIGSTPDDII